MKPCIQDYCPTVSSNLATPLSLCHWNKFVWLQRLHCLLCLGNGRHLGVQVPIGLIHLGSKMAVITMHGKSKLCNPSVVHSQSSNSKLNVVFCLHAWEGAHCSIALRLHYYCPPPPSFPRHTPLMLPVVIKPDVVD